MKIELTEYFAHALREGPRDTTFKPAPEVKVSGEEDPPLDTDPGLGAEPAMTQDVAPMEGAELDFFAKNAQSAVAKYADLANEGFDTQALVQFASALDQLVGQIYQAVQDPAERQGFEVDAQKVSGDFSKDLSKLFDKVLKLKAYGNQY